MLIIIHFSYFELVFNLPSKHYNQLNILYLHVLICVDSYVGLGGGVGGQWEGL